MQDNSPDILRGGFATGTRLRTERGEVPVEELRPGDRLVTSSAEHRLVRRIQNGRPAEARAVLIPAESVGDGRPSRELRVSADQQVCLKIVSDCLVPVSALVEKSTFEAIRVEGETFWRVVLDEDDIIYAEGLPMPSGPGVDPSRAEPIEDRHFIELVRAILKGRASKLGWVLDQSPPLDLHILADGIRIDPASRDGSFRFLLPTTASDVWLVSESTIPKDVGFNPDQRLLGASLAGMRIEDGLDVSRAIDLGDPLLTTGFHKCESDHRWTDGCAHLPTALWADCQDVFFLTVRLAAPPVPRYRPPGTAAPRPTTA